MIDNNSGFKTGFGSYIVEQDKELLKFYKNIIDIRNKNEQLKTVNEKLVKLERLVNELTAVKNVSLTKNK